MRDKNPNIALQFPDDFFPSGWACEGGAHLLETYLFFQSSLFIGFEFCFFTDIINPEKQSLRMRD